MSVNINGPLYPALDLFAVLATSALTTVNTTTINNNY